jgi:hypothetical protein
MTPAYHPPPKQQLNLEAWKTPEYLERENSVFEE